MAEGVYQRLLRKMDEAEEKAWKCLAAYKFWMFGYYAARWVTLNKLKDVPARISPFKKIVSEARAICRNKYE